MTGMIKILTFLSLKQLLLLALAVIKAISEKTKTKADDDFVKLIESVITKFNEYLKNFS
jgi:hypothetical protein